jgi:hypothetical protein
VIPIIAQTNMMTVIHSHPTFENISAKAVSPSPSIFDNYPTPLTAKEMIT